MLPWGKILNISFLKALASQFGVSGSVKLFTINASSDKKTRKEETKRLRKYGRKHRSKVEKLVAFYVVEHNTRLPHSAFHGQTPDEMYFETGDDIPKRLESARTVARQTRMAVNRAMTCTACRPLEFAAS